MLTQEEALLVELGIIYKALSILEQKRRDYSGNKDPFGNFRIAETVMDLDPFLGATVRQLDKLKRSVELVKRGSMSGQVGENLTDTLSDEINYVGIRAGLLAERNEEFKEELIECGHALPGLLRRMLEVYEIYEDPPESIYTTEDIPF